MAQAAELTTQLNFMRQSNDTLFMRILKREIYDDIQYYELVVVMKTKKKKEFCFVVVTNDYAVLIDYKCKQPPKYINLTKIEEIQKPQDIPDFLQEQLAAKSKHIVLLCRVEEGVMEEVEFFTIENDSRIAYHLERKRHSAMKSDLRKRRGSQHVTDISVLESNAMTNDRFSSRRGSTSTKTVFSPGKDRRVKERLEQKCTELFNQLERELYSCKDIGRKADLVEELSVAVEGSMDVKKCFFKSRKMMEFVIDEMDCYFLDPPSLRKNEFIFETMMDELEYCQLLAELVANCLSDSSSVAQRLNLVKMEEPYGVRDLLDLLLTGPKGFHVSEDGESTRTIRLKRRDTRNRDDEQLALLGRYEATTVTILLELDDFAKQGRMSGEKFDSNWYLAILLKFPNFVETKVTAMFNRVIKLLTTERTEEDMICLYQHVKFLNNILFSNPELRAFFDENYEEEMKYFFKNPDITEALHRDMEETHWVDGIIHSLENIADLCGVTAVQSRRER